MRPDVVAQLRERGLAREDEGALCVFFDDQPELGKSPMIVQKKDGAYLYSTTDIATALYRRDQFKTERAIYVVDKRQSLHFKQLFAVLARLGVSMQLEHVSFGTVLGKGGRPLKTRDGGTIKLAELLDEAVSRAAEHMRRAREENMLELSDAQIAELAPVVGIGAVRYADLMQNRSSDYQFDWDKMISFKGNAGPYMQYAYARTRNIFARGDVPESERRGPIALVAPEEKALGRQLLRFGEAVHQAAEGSFPHLVAEHLYALARAFSAFYVECKVLDDSDPATRTSRLALTELTSRQLRTGLGLLGIDVVERM
jgi:arginyl-tRNA synthetase